MADRTAVRARLLPLLLTAACAPAPGGAAATSPEPAAAATSSITPGPDWARRAVCYEIFVRSFQDGDGDGVGDIPGLISRLDYLNDGNPSTDRDLGIDCIWLMPVAESPSYHGYDVEDYTRVDREYGTDDDFRRLTDEAHRRGIRVIVDLVLNHSSSRHAAFQAALNDPSSPTRSWYRWLPAHPGVKNPWGGDNWHRSPVRDEYFYGFFWSGMPDFDYQSPGARAEANRVATWWLREMGVDGFRLDAVSFLVEESHSAVQHTAGTRQFLREFGAHVRSVSPHAYTVGEVWDSTATLLGYYPDQLDHYFAFEVSDALIAAVRAGTADTLMKAMSRAFRDLPDQRFGTFQRNHDQERTLTALAGEPRRAFPAATLLLTMPGTPYLYYGEEIGMAGGKDGAPEADMGMRTPMHWSPGPGAGFTTGRPWYAPRPEHATVNVAAQADDPASLLSHYRRLIRLRRSHAALAVGEWIPLQSSHPAVAAYLRREGGETVLVLVNLGGAPVEGARLQSAGAVLPAGPRRVSSLLGGGSATSLTVAADGTLSGYLPFATLEPYSSHVLAID